MEARSSSSARTRLTNWGDLMIGILIAILVAALVYYVCVLVGLPTVVAIIAAILVLLAGVGTGGGWFNRRGGV
jgi:uncharacterized protein YacL